MKEYVDLAVADLKAYHDAEVSAINRQMTEIQRQVTELHDMSSDYLKTDQYQERHDLLSNQIITINNWRANMMGKLVIYSVVGALFLVVATAFFTHLLSST